MSEAISTYVAEVGDGSFPTSENSSSMDADVLAEVLEEDAFERPAYAAAMMTDGPIPLDRDL
jgi:hypothetical protein